MDSAAAGFVLSTEPGSDPGARNEIPMSRLRTIRLLSSLAVAALVLSAAAPAVAGCPGSEVCPMISAPPPCHTMPSRSTRESPFRLGVGDCCVHEAPALPVAVVEALVLPAPENLVTVSSVPALQRIDTSPVRSAAAPAEEGPPLAACERLSLLQTFLI